ncbi:ABC transporter substrate-binding protein [Paenibacillus sp. NPDC056579]|uniref:ABC transporter substrate-binding protein n=1 Tax=Paenibacillus sp. NPDC056579 TaxID=3345871 RepID=UPI0036891272
MKKLKTYSIFFLLFIMVFSIAGCTSGQDPSGDADAGDGKITLTVTSSMTDEARVNIMNQTIKIFNQTHPNVRIRYNPSPWANYAQNLKLAFNSDSGQDIVYVDDTMQQMLQKNNYLMDITNDVKSRGWIDKQLSGAVDFQNARTPGRYYSIPFMTAPVTVFYNKDIFNKLNLTPPKTMDEFNTILEKVKAAGYVPMENGGLSNLPKMWSLFDILYNKVPMDDIKQFYFQKGITPAFEKGFVTALNQINDWSDKGYYRSDDASIDGAAVPQYYAKGQSVMVLAGNWDIPTYEGTKIPTGAFAFPPASANTPTHPTVNATDGGWALNAKLSDEKKQAALDFIDTFMNPDVVKLWYEGGSTPTVKADMLGAKASELKKEVDLSVQSTQMGFFLDNAVPGLGDILNKQLQLLYFHKATPEQAWTEIKSQYNKLVQASQGQ